MSGSNSTRTRGGGPDATPPLFREVQRFKQWIFWIPVAGVVGVIWWQFVEQVVRGHPQGTEPISNWLAWVLTIVFGVGLPVLAWALRLITEVRPGELSVRLAPFRGVSIQADHILKAVVREYSPLREYGGWGVRISRVNGRAYNAYGNRGVQLVVAGKDLILVGSQRPEELLAALQTAGADLTRFDRAAAEAESDSDDEAGE